LFCLVIALLNNDGTVAEGYSYDAFGKPYVHTGAGLDGVWLTDDDTTAINPVSAYGNRIMFTAREYDNESGLYYYRARMYHPVLGRFMSPEPVIMHLLRVWAAENIKASRKAQGLCNFCVFSRVF